METIMGNKKNPDLSNSAVNLTNNVTVKELLDSLHTYQRNKTELQEKIEARTPDLHIQLYFCRERISLLKVAIKKAVDDNGSFQDVVAGIYAVKQKVKHTSYDAEAFETHFPGYVPAVIDITKTVNKVGLARLLKSGKITEQALRNAKVITESETSKYIIR